MHKLLLHMCCGPCSAHVIEELTKDYDVTLFWSNSNIWPIEEYQKRLENARKIATIYEIPIIEDTYAHELWLMAVKGLEKEPEGGKRCAKCFEFNLNRTADLAARKGFELFTTTLTISPHKDTQTIFDIGRRLAEKYKIRFLEQDFKKDSGFEHTMKLSREYDLYRQNYCGCEFSMRSSITSPKE